MTGAIEVEHFGHWSLEREAGLLRCFTACDIKYLELNFHDTRSLSVFLHGYDGREISFGAEPRSPNERIMMRLCATGASPAPPNSFHIDLKHPFGWIEIDTSKGVFALNTTTDGLLLEPDTAREIASALLQSAYIVERIRWDRAKEERVSQTQHQKENDS